MLRRCGWIVACLLALLAVGAPAWAQEEDGYALWLRYRLLSADTRGALSGVATSLVSQVPDSPTVAVARSELQRGLASLLGRVPADGGAPRDGALVLARPTASLAATLGSEGYAIQRTRWQGADVTLISANSDIGLLYGSFAYLRELSVRGAAAARIDLHTVPRLKLRVLDHWDNPDRSVERGYAGESIWNWWQLPDVLDPRYVDYARANASIGINGVVLNNVNAKAEMLTAPFIAKTAALADVLRPYGQRVYLSVRWSTPLELKETRSADPLDPDVARWWQHKADEIYRAIPDFGGFLVKANSEGQPGPQDYHRDHAQGANMLARALARHGGIVMWRAFVYAQDKPGDRAGQAYDQFKPLDGKFDANVLLQVKNGPIDFQPREPAHPLFGAMPHTPLMMEVQLTKEYLGFATHLAYLGPLFQEVLRTQMPERVGHLLTGMAGVANGGSERNWSGSHFDQANWYAYGRLAWDPDADAEAIARDWVAQTFASDAHTVDAITAIMMMSREAVVDYMTPLGLHHLMGTGHHYGPAPWVNDLARPDWNPTYYHRADRSGIGFDRRAIVKQYPPALARLYADPRTTPENLLLWFHHLPWDYTMPSGRTLWSELLAHYDRGVAAVADMQSRWAALQPFVDARRHADVSQRLAVQLKEATWWRDACIAYFQSVSGLPLPPDVRPPAHPLRWYKAQRFPYAPGHA